MIRAVAFDLDDTLFLQESWLEGAWAAVALAGADQGADVAALHAALVAIAAEGTDRGRIIDRALTSAGAPHCDVAPLVEAFRTHRPATLPLAPGARDGLRQLRDLVPVGLVTDGDPVIQRAKVAALGLDGCFDAVVYSDELGREHRKPDPAPFLQVLAGLGAEPADTVYVGDRPEKDVRGPAAVGMRAIRVRTGEHAGRPDEAGTWRSVPTVADAISLLVEACSAALPPIGTTAARATTATPRTAPSR